jgi:ribosome-binding ATPase YchF (GTP1/OBG family)
MLRLEQGSNLKLKAEVADKSSRIIAISAQYEEQIVDIKEMLSLKDEELRRLSSALLVTDVDLIRLRVVNELELAHKEQLEGLHRDLTRRDT